MVFIKYKNTSKETLDVILFEDTPWNTEKILLLDSITHQQNLMKKGGVKLKHPSLNKKRGLLSFLMFASYSSGNG